MKLAPIDRLLLALAAMVIVLLAFLSLLSARSAEQEPAATPTPAIGGDVALAVPKVIPTPAPEPDKPVYAPAIPLSEDLQHILWAACEEHNVDPVIALGLIEVESGFDTGADTGLCYGLMQLNRQYFQSGLPPSENIRYGVEYLGQLLARYNTVEAALTAYNAGHDTGSRVYANAVLAAAKKWRDING